MKMLGKTIWFVLVLAVSASAADYSVKADGSGNYSTIQACANAMANGDTCTVFAGTYSEHPSVPAGTSGSPKTITVNGNDVVHVLGFTLGNYVNVIGNCPVPSSIGT